MSNASLRAAVPSGPRRRVAVAAAAAGVVGTIVAVLVLTGSGAPDRPEPAASPTPAPTTAPRPAPSAPPGTRVQTVFAAAPRGIATGDVVDVIAAFDPAFVPDAEPSRRVARRARVLAVGDPQTSTAAVTELTLAVVVPEDEQVAFASRYGDLTVTLAPGDDDGDGDGDG